MQQSKKPRSTTDSQDSSTETAERRRIARIVHDERGNASVEWSDAPVDFERPLLSVADSPGLKAAPPRAAAASKNAFDPYARTTADASPASAPSDRKKPKDLRRLSEWIKMMRELEARKQSDE